MIIDSPIISGSQAVSGSLNQFGNAAITGSLTVSGSTFAAKNNVTLGTDSTNTVVINSTIDSNIVPYEGGTRNLGSDAAKWDNIYANAFTGSLFGTSSFALTASYATNAGAGAGFPFSGSAQITGSLLITELSGSGVRYLTTDNTGLIIAQTASAAIKITEVTSSTAGQTEFTIPNGYTTGLVDVYINGSKLSAAEFTDTSGTVITLATGSNDGDTVEFVKYFPASGVTNNALRQLTTFTASAGQTVFSASYTPGLLDIYYNGARLSTSDYTANNGTYITLATASAANDILDVLVYSYQVGAFSGIGGQGVASQVAYFGTTNAITGSPNFSISGSTMTVTGSLLVSGSGTFTNIGPAVMSGSLNVSGAITTNSTITAQTLVVQTITSSVSVITGSTNFGSLAANTHTFTGSMFVSGNLQLGKTLSTGVGVTTPVSMSMGSTFGTNTVGTNFKLKLYDDTTPNPFGLGVSDSLLEIIAGTGGALGFFTNGSNERIRITSGGNVGIGTSNPSDGNGFGRIVDLNGTGAAAYYARYASSSTLYSLLGQDSGYTYLLTKSTPLLLFTNNAEAVRITTAGRVFIGTTTGSPGASGFDTRSLHVNSEIVSMGSSAGLFFENRSGGVTSNSNWYGWYNTGGTIYLYTVGVGNIGNFNSSTGNYTATSDINRKKDIELYTNSGLDAILGLKPTLYRMKNEDESVEKHLGFVAQEVKDFIPQAYVETIAEEKDGGVHIGLDYQAITVNLVKAIQEQQTLITSLQTRIEQLENK